MSVCASAQGHRILESRSGSSPPARKVNHMIALRALVPSVGFAWLRMSTTSPLTEMLSTDLESGCAAENRLGNRTDLISNR